MLIRSTKATCATIVAATITIVLGCSEGDTISPQSKLNSAAFSFVPMSNCGASFRVIANETDSLLVQYGIENTVDTVDICEAWTGSDYDYQVVGVGSSENVPGVMDTVQTVTYQGGYVTGYTETGANAADPSNVGPTAFDFMKADNSAVQASYDDPYYGVSSHDPGVCIHPPCAEQSIGVAQAPPAAAASRLVVPGAVRLDIIPGQDTLFRRHGLTRRGVRALVDASEEIAPSAQGLRRFKQVKGTTTIVRSIHPLTQLIMAEEWTTPDEDMRMTHQWTRVAGGYVKDRSKYVSVQQIEGRAVTSTGTIQLTNVHITDPAYPPLHSLGATP
jgi:hypothetical protein